MRVLSASSRAALLASQLGRRSARLSASPAASVGTELRSSISTNRAFNRRPDATGLDHAAPSATRLFSSTSSGSDEIQIVHIGREEMEEIIEDYEAGGREETGYVVIDVREKNEIEYTGKLSPNTNTMPLQTIMAVEGFTLDEPDFENVFGFPKPTPDETLVFSCAAGIRSVHAANFAKASGYSKLVNYVGGANEWFAPN